VRNYTLPSPDECDALIREYRVPVHIVRHSEVTARLGRFLAERLNARGQTVDVDLVDRACLLHDLLRVCDFPLQSFSGFAQQVTDADVTAWRRLKARHEGTRHEEAAANRLRTKYPVLAEAIRKHRYTALVDGDDRPRTWEEKLVYYADKRVMHDRIVPLRIRLEDAHRRNAFRREAAGITDELLARVDAAIVALEAEIFGTIGIEPDSVTAEFIDAFNATNTA
jgi:hypothetical protein